MARRAAIPLPVPRSAAAGGVGARPGKSLAPDRSRGQAGGSAHGKRPPPGRGRAGGGGRSLRSWIEFAVGLVVESRGAGFRGPAGSRRLEGSGRPRSCRGQDSGAGPGRSFRHREGIAGSRRRPKAVSGLLKGLAGHMAKSGKRDSPARVKVRKRRDAEGERSPRARAGRKGANEGDGGIATVMSSDKSQELTIDPVGPWISGARP